MVVIDLRLTNRETETYGDYRVRSRDRDWHCLAVAGGDGLKACVPSFALCFSL
ncbi:hypothetical protein HanXRQr2_Chr17g0789341 [Helianthus annuus]|uniref:Uncharacterized protein n=1 Tax=Helianthus annuus TaxID=4232 RepID=A0A9K3GTI4_HELAN|nr:hypothetical protein HanXRQr2_Chr17g0789341 [Helianthus annuus]